MNVEKLFCGEMFSHLRGRILPRHSANPFLFPHQTSIKTMDEIDLLREQQKILSGEVALHSSALKRLSEEAAKNPRKEHIHVMS